MELDQVVGRNVERLREDRGWSRLELAKKLGVKRHVVYEYEGATRQRVFKLEDLVALTGVFECVLAEFLLPAEGVEVDAGWAWPLIKGGWEYEVDESAARREHKVTREVLARQLFGVPPEMAVLTSKYARDELKRLAEEAERHLAPFRDYLNALAKEDE